MSKDQLEEVARSLVAPGKGILAADESSGTIEKRLKSISTPSTEDNRRAYREMLFRTPGAGEFVSGVILYDETIRQKAADGTPLVAFPAWSAPALAHGLLYVQGADRLVCLKFLND